jgi:hypothetical protein
MKDYFEMVMEIFLILLAILIKNMWLQIHNYQMFLLHELKITRFKFYVTN